ncbi:MAG: Hint domain-containing protein [Myxococcota bacterium]|nr:Hint domain-containing protein [Myxococcota bacterium]
MKLHGKTLLISVAFGLTGCFPMGCFVARTRVDTPDGPRPIDALKKGDVVWAWSEAEGARVERRVEAVHRTLGQVVCRVEVGEHVIPGVTPEHPFFHVDAGEFVALRDLPTDALLLTVVDGEPRQARISGLEITEHLEPCVMVFNLTVEGPEHTYFAEGVLVHNKQPVTICPDGSVTGRDYCGGDTYSLDGGVAPDGGQVTGDAGPPEDAGPPDDA